LEVTEEDVDAEPPKKIKRRRYLLFLGNLRDGVTKDDVLHFFGPTSGIIEVRLLYDKKTKYFRGCGFLDLADRKSFQDALEKSGAPLLGKPIRIELTSGGSGNSNQRRTKIKVKNDIYQQTKAKRRYKEKPKQTEKNEKKKEESKAEQE